MKNLFLAFLIFVLISMFFVHNLENDQLVFYMICTGSSWGLTAIVYAATLRPIKFQELQTNIFAIEHLIENRDAGDIDIYFKQFFELFDKEFCCNVEERYPFYDNIELFFLLKRYIHVNHKN
jgi:hypothetical protein